MRYALAGKGFRLVNAQERNLWKSVAYDIEVAKSLFSAKHYLHVGFMCHLIVEKSPKAVIARSGFPPRSHSLTNLARVAGLVDEMSEEQLDALDLLEPMNLEPRYPDDIERLLRTVDAKRAALMMAKVEELHEWIRTR